MYNPLPKSVVVKESTIHGYGLFATDTIKKGTNLGVSHIYGPGFETSYIRTPIGGFINHSEEPNCIKIESPEESMLTYFSLVVLKDIEKYEELTLTYTLYTV